jgi:dTDP-4-dehydrorhamnose 3,5-epimerase
MIEINSKFKSLITTQSYKSKDAIEDVKLIDLPLYNDDCGAFSEIVRLHENNTVINLEQFHAKQLSWSNVLPGVIKAFHLHYTQDDLWFIPPSESLLIGLFDCRENKTGTMRFVMGAGKAQILYIPKGVAHGYTNHTNEKQSIIYLTSQHYNRETPDERRLPWDTLGKEFWEIQKG